MWWPCQQHVVWGRARGAYEEGRGDGSPMDGGRLGGGVPMSHVIIRHVSCHCIYKFGLLQACITLKNLSYYPAFNCS